MKIERLNFWINYLKKGTRNYNNCLPLDKTETKEILLLLEEFKKKVQEK